MLVTLVDPSAVVRGPYVQYAAATVDGVVRTGIIAEQDGASITLADAQGQKARLPRDRLDSLKELPTSLMPEKLLDPLTRRSGGTCSATSSSRSRSSSPAVPDSWGRRTSGTAGPTNPAPAAGDMLTRPGSPRLPREAR